MSKKKLSVVLSLLFSLVAIPAAQADQCAWFKKDVGERAAFLLKAGDSVRQYCPSCGDKKPAAAIKVEKVVVQKVAGQEGFWELLVNGKSMDLAYVFYRRASSKETYHNLAHLAHCPAEIQEKL